MRLWDATERSYEAELELDDHKIPPLEHYPNLETARAIAESFRRHHEENQPPPRMRFVPDGAPSSTRQRNKLKRR
jgi:hypothetical protein